MATTATGRWLATAACCTLWRLHSYGGTARRVSGVMLPSAGAPHGSGPDGVALPDAGEGRGNGSAPGTDLQAQLGDMPEVHSVASEGFSGFRAYSAALPGAGEGQPWHHVQQMWRAALHGTMQLGAAGVGRPGHSNKRPELPDSCPWESVCCRRGHGNSCRLQAAWPRRSAGAVWRDT